MKLKPTMSFLEINSGFLSKTVKSYVNIEHKEKKTWVPQININSITNQHQLHMPIYIHIRL